MKTRFTTYLWQHLVVALCCVAITVGTVPMTACNAGTILQDITKFLPVVTDILSIVTSFTGSDESNLNAKIQQDAQIVENVYSTYEQNVGNVTAWNALNAAFTTFEADAQQIFQLAQISNPTVQAKVSAMVAAAQTLFAIIEALVPSAPAGAQATKPHLFAAHAPAPGTTLGQWVDGWNALVKAKTGNAALDGATAGMQIHIHGWLLRQVSFHALK